MIKIEYIYAGLLLHSAKQPINEENLTKILSASGINVDKARVKALVAALSEINIDEVIKSAISMPTVGAPASAQPQPVVEEKKEAPKEEEAKKEEESVEGLSALFG
ncbi:MAG: 50S ribosomal protein P1 [Candidatus Methanomethyliaceae archaeon]|nr:50S ribosomal protein P1 [Candidatus Methanomethyliaceae archaeon]